MQTLIATSKTINTSHIHSRMGQQTVIVHQCDSVLHHEKSPVSISAISPWTLSLQTSGSKGWGGPDSEHSYVSGLSTTTVAAGCSSFSFTSMAYCTTCDRVLAHAYDGFKEAWQPDMLSHISVSLCNICEAVCEKLQV